jgi:hypothetical protein
MSTRAVPEPPLSVREPALMEHPALCGRSGSGLTGRDEASLEPAMSVKRWAIATRLIAARRPDRLSDVRWWILLRDRDVTEALARIRLRIHSVEASSERVGDSVCGLSASID